MWLKPVRYPMIDLINDRLRLSNYTYIIPTSSEREDLIVPNYFTITNWRHIMWFFWQTNLTIVAAWISSHMLVSKLKSLACISLRIMICKKKKPRANYLFAPNREYRELNFQLLTYVPCFMSRNCCYSSALARGTGQVSRLEKIVKLHASTWLLFFAVVLKFKYSEKSTKMWINLPNF